MKTPLAFPFLSSQPRAAAARAEGSLVAGFDVLQSDFTDSSIRSLRSLTRNDKRVQILVGRLVRALFSVIPSEGARRPSRGIPRTRRRQRFLAEAGKEGWFGGRPFGHSLAAARHDAQRASVSLRMSRAHHSPGKSGGPSTPASLPVSSSSFGVTGRDAFARDDSVALSRGGGPC